MMIYILRGESLQPLYLSSYHVCIMLLFTTCCLLVFIKTSIILLNSLDVPFRCAKIFKSAIMPENLAAAKTV